MSRKRSQTGAKNCHKRDHSWWKGHLCTAVGISIAASGHATVVLRWRASHFTYNFLNRENLTFFNTSNRNLMDQENSKRLEPDSASHFRHLYNVVATSCILLLHDHITLLNQGLHLVSNIWNRIWNLQRHSFSWLPISLYKNQKDQKQRQ